MRSAYTPTKPGTHPQRAIAGGCAAAVRLALLVSVTPAQDLVLRAKLLLVAAKFGPSPRAGRKVSVDPASDFDIRESDQLLTLFVSSNFGLGQTPSLNPAAGCHSKFAFSRKEGHVDL